VPVSTVQMSGSDQPASAGVPSIRQTFEALLCSSCVLYTGCGLPSTGKPGSDDCSSGCKRSAPSGDALRWQTGLCFRKVYCPQVCFRRV
jgi:hypothetical protein